MKAALEFETKAGGLLGIRLGVWIFALATLFLCTLPSIIQLENIPPPTSVPSADPPVLARHAALIPSRMAHYADAATALTVEQAHQLACSLANEKARELYGCAPFVEGAAPEFVDGGWRWSACRGQGLVDFEARVEFSANGAEPNVWIQVLDIRSPSMW